MSSRIGRVWRGVSLACLWLAAAVVTTPAVAQVRNAGAMPDGRGGTVPLGINDYQSCALRSDGEAECWGIDGSSGRATPPAGPFIALSNALNYTCALRGDGTAACWGSEFSGLARPPAGAFTAIASTSMGITCGIKARSTPWSPLENNVQCWNERGGPSLIPPAAPYVAITGGGHHFCGLTGDGRPACWSDGTGFDYGQTNAPAEPFVAISAGFWFTCGLRADGSVACWGANDQGQSTPPAERFSAIAAGVTHVCGLRSSGEVQCWGSNTNGQSSAPAGRFVAIDADGGNTCGIRSDGRLECWGKGFADEKPLPAPDTVFGAHSMATGGWETCHLGADGQLDCWGYNPYSQAPAGLFNDVGIGERFGCARGEDGVLRCWGDGSNGQLLAPATAASKLGVGENHACALLAADGSAACWGWETNGQTLAPAGVFRDVSAGFVHSCAVRDNGDGACWGYDADGQTSVPALPQFLGYQSIQAGERFSCGLRSDGAIACWGMSGDGGAMQSPQGTFRAMAIGSYHGCAIRADNGQLSCWGENWSGQLEAPTGVFVSVSGGRDYSCAVRIDGTRMCWPSRGITIEPNNLPAMGPDEAYSVALSVQTPTGPAANPSFALISGSLPPGITMGSDGVIAGASGEPGLYTVTIEANDGAGSAAQRRIDLLVDDTPPVLTPSISGTLGENGWYTSNTWVGWSMSDESEIRSSQGCFHYLTSDQLPAEYTCQATSAGGTSSSTVTVKVDKTVPNTTFTVTPGATSNQYSPRFEFSGQDATSGVAGFECSLDNAAWSACASPLTHNVNTGSHTLRVRAVDAAGLRDTSPASHTWFMDPTPPTITPFVSGILGWNGWYMSDVQVTFSVDEPQSTITASTGCNTVTVTTDTIGATFTCTVTSAGGTSSRTVSLKRDATAPVITAAATSAPNAAGWYRGDVTVGYSCSDTASGVSVCPTAQVLGDEGTAIASTARTITDAAGNSATSNVVTVNIDRTAPTLAPTLPATTLLLNAVTAASANGSDALSGIGVQSCDSVATASVGSKSIARTVTDAAGNSASASVGYRVIYAFTGFSSPVQNPSVLNVLKAGRSVPLRWRVTDAQGAPVTNLGSASVSAIAISCPSASENRISTYGGNNGQLQNLGNGYYQLDWSSASALRGYCRRLELNLGDGEAYPALFKFN